MRKKLFMTALLMVVSLGVYAQFVNTSSKKNNLNTDDTWFSFRASYNPITFDVDGIWGSVFGEELSDFNGFSGEFIMGFNVANGEPIFIETGAGFLYASNKYKDSYTDDYYEMEMSLDLKTKIASVYIPFNIAYEFSVSDNMSIIPYAGLKARINISGDQNLTMTIRDTYYGYSETVRESIDMFSKRDISNNWGVSDEAKRFQLGWQIGADFDISGVILGISYGTDISEFLKDCKFKTTSLSLGFRF
jgi:hypothetical protein